MREQIKQILEWLHATLLFVLWIPVVYMLLDIRGAEYGYGLYVRCFLIALVVVVTGIAGKKCKSLLSYLGCALLVSAVTVGISWLLRPTAYGMIYVVCMGFFSLFITGKRFRDRIRIKRDEDELKNDPYWTPGQSGLEKPTFGIFGYFVVMYLFGVGFDCKTVCDEVLFTAFLYSFVVIPHVFLVGTQDYLQMNHRVSGLPVRRIYGIAGGVLGVFLLMVLLTVIPTILTIPFRQYTDIRTWVDTSSISGAEVDMEFLEPQRASLMNSPMMGDLPEQTGTLAIWVEVVLYTICGAALLVVVWAAIQEIRKVFSDFRETYDENGDKIEVLEAEDSVVLLRRNHSEAEDLETKNIRKKYRKMIRKHRKDRPAVYESPKEIEEQAGLLQDEDMQKLHVAYEEVRYGK